MSEKQEFKDVVDQIHWHLTQLNSMGYKMTDEFVAKMIAKYCVDVAPVIVRENIKS